MTICTFEAFKRATIARLCSSSPSSSCPMAPITRFSSTPNPDTSPERESSKSNGTTSRIALEAPPSVFGLQSDSFELVDAEGEGSSGVYSVWIPASFVSLRLPDSGMLEKYHSD